MPRKVVVFDLDGTLLDTLEDIADAANAVLRGLGFSTHPTEAYQVFVGEGVRRLFEQAMPEGDASGEVLDQCVQGFQREYELCWNVKTRPYVGVPALLDSLTSRGTPLGVLSNKPHEFTTKCVNHFLSRWRFHSVFGTRPGFPRKPDPAVLHSMLEATESSGAQCLYVGDTPVDMQTAKAAGCTAVGVAWGFRPVSQLLAAGADHIAETPEAIDALFEAIGP